MGVAIAVGRFQKIDELSASWTMDTDYGGRAAHTRVTALRWDDLVRDWWRKGTWAVMASVPGWTWSLLRRGIYGLAGRRARPLFLSVILPPLVLVAMLTLVAAIALLVGLVQPWLGAVAVVAGLYLMPWAWKQIDRRIGLGWLTQSLRYFVLSGTRALPEQEARCALFAERLISAMDQDDVDEVLLVGFSMGANQAVRTLGLALEQRPDLGQGRTRLGLLTVGQCCGVYGLMPGDDSFRRARVRLARTTAIGWADATSASDPASACTISPLLGLEDVPAGRIRSRAPRFHKVLTPERFRAIRRDPLAFHFQYMGAVDIPGGYDWFEMTGGPGFACAPEGAR